MFRFRITPKNPYIDWANSFEDDGPELDPKSLHHSAYLIPDEYDEIVERQ
jgi:hypothetical protein